MLGEAELASLCGLAGEDRPMYCIRRMHALLLYQNRKGGTTVPETVAMVFQVGSAGEGGRGWGGLRFWPAEVLHSFPTCQDV